MYWKETSSEENECCYYQYSGIVRSRYLLSVYGNNCEEIGKTKDLVEFKTEKQENQKKYRNSIIISILEIHIIIV